MIVTAQSHPALFEVFETVSHDSGGSAGHKSYLVPPTWDSAVDVSETALASLTEADLDTFSIGEHTEVEEIASRHPSLKVAHDMLNAFFDDGGWCPVCHGDHA